jgi:hypothetical protein
MILSRYYQQILIVCADADKEKELNALSNLVSSRTRTQRYYDDLICALKVPHDKINYTIHDIKRSIVPERVVSEVKVKTINII